MKFSYVSAVAALAAAAALAGCGGKAQYTVQGTITGLANSGLILANNGSDTVTVASGATSFAFSKQIDYGTDYNITVKQQPAHMNCVVSGATGSAGHNITIQSLVSCAQNEYTLGGQFTGLTAAADGTARTVVLLNGSNVQLTVSSASGTSGTGEFLFGSTVADGQAYGVTILTQPTGLTCTLANGTGVMHEAAVSNLLLTCVP